MPSFVMAKFKHNIRTNYSIFINIITPLMFVSERDKVGKVNFVTIVNAKYFMFMIMLGVFYYLYTSRIFPV